MFEILEHSNLPVCYSDKHFVNSSPDNILFESRKRKVFEF